MQVVLLGDSHLSRVTGRHWGRLTRLLPGHTLTNVAVGGSTVRDLPRQLALAPVLDAAVDVVIISIGTNDVSTAKHVSTGEMQAICAALKPQLPRLTVLLESPGVVEGASLGAAAMHRFSVTSRCSPKR